jgi:CHAD domain-containing protein
VQLLEHLGNRRVKAAWELHRIIVGQKREARHRLKRHSGFIEGEIESARSSISNGSWAADAMAVSFQLESELGEWPKLHRGNVHPFRLKVKELRYILQLAEDNDSEFIETLGEVKDVIGEWHDWNELASIADDALDHGPAGKLSKRIRDHVKEKFENALTIANRMRRKYFDGIPRRRGERRRPTRLKNSAVRATSRLAG